MTKFVGTKYAGANWLKKHLDLIYPVNLLATRVANVLGQVYDGIYHLKSSFKNLNSLKPSAREITLSLYGPMATCDSARLTRLFLCCQAASIDVSIAGGMSGYMRFTFKNAKRVTPTIKALPDVAGFEDLADLESLNWRSLIGKSGSTYLRKSPWISVHWDADGSVSAFSLRSGVIAMPRLAEIVSRAHSSCCRIELEGRCPNGHGQIALFMSERSPTATTITQGHPTAAQAVEWLRPIWDIDYTSLN